MRTLIASLALSLPSLLALAACTEPAEPLPALAGDDDDGAAGEGEGEVSPAEGEGEGEGDAGEGEGEGEGEGDSASEGEGEGEGEGDGGAGACNVLNAVGAPLGSHCRGTNIQDITGVQHVAFVGDSVTVGTPPTPSAEFYRSLAADMLAERFGLEPPGFLWRTANPLDGTASQMHSGDFSSCAKWGARTDDLVQDQSQLADCLPDTSLTSLVFMTAGGNDVFKIGQARAEGRPPEEIEAMIQNQYDALEQALQWLKEPGRFPNGIYVVMANTYEFTDRTGNTASCPGAAEVGYGQQFADVAQITQLVADANARYLELAVQYGVDVVFMEEEFCGHGFAAGDAASPCYSPGAEVFFDFTCIHPSAAGHARLAEIFMDVVDE